MVERVRINADSTTPYDLITKDPQTGSILETQTVTVQGSYDVMHDRLTEDFHRKKNDGFVIMSPMDHVKSEFSQTVGGWKARLGACSNTSVGELAKEQTRWYPPGNPASKPIYGNTEINSAIEQVKAVALAEAFANVEEPDLDALVTLAEGRKTLALISSTVFQIAKKAQKIRRSLGKPRRKGRNRRAPTRLEKAKYLENLFHEKWLEGRYGWRPLFYEVMGMVDYYNRQNQKPLRRRSLGQDETSDVVENTTIQDDDWLVEWHDRCQFRVSARAGVMYDWSGDLGPDIVNAFGLNRPATVVWELVPYSFVVDWFTNIGDYVSAWEPKAGVKQLGAWCTVRINARIEGHYDIQSELGPDTGWCLLEGGKSDYIQTYERQFRTIHTTPPILPTIDYNGLNPQQILDSVSLMRNILLGFSNSRLRI